jgi:hypothetical protein
MPEDNRPRPDLYRFTVPDAAATLGVTQDAVRKRIARGTIPHERDEEGRVYVYIDLTKTGKDTDQDDATKTVQDAYLRSMEDQIRFLREELQRKDAILLSLTERIPELEAAKEEEPEARSWWRRLLGS